MNFRIRMIQDDKKAEIVGPLTIWAHPPFVMEPFKQLFLWSVSQPVEAKHQGDSLHILCNHHPTHTVLIKANLVWAYCMDSLEPSRKAAKFIGRIFNTAAQV